MSQAVWDRSTIGGVGRFEGKVVVVSGGAPGVGRAVAEAFAAEGGSVVFCRGGEGLGRKVEAAIHAAGGEALWVRVDVLRQEEIRALVGQG